MSERILRALMQLFAIIAKIDEVTHSSDSESNSIQSSKGKEIIEGFLKSELSSSDVNKYLTIFEDYLSSTRGKLYTKSGEAKRTSLQSVKVLRICEQINKELTQRQKFIVLVRIFEFMHLDNQTSEIETEFISTVADSFHIQELELQLISSLINSSKDQFVDNKNTIYYTPKKNTNSFSNTKFQKLEGLDAPIHAVYLERIKTIFFRFLGDDELYINGQFSSNDKIHVFNVGSTVRTNKSAQLFYSDIISKLTENVVRQQLSYKMNNIIHSFNSGKDAVRKISLETTEGQLVGIMGGSGTGKTTLLNIMNGKISPSLGSIHINKINLHSESEILEGVIGNVSQDDLLIEELTVFENLFFSAKLSMKLESDNAINKIVVDLLHELGLYEIRRLKVGGPLDKVISGGQRKRLNIALELIREPSILFVDEPTSGLSSRDSENIMDLLKELTFKGKLIFVVIHQPSSTIFKLFDRLLILDEGGYPIYDGIPLHAISHFKTFSYMGNAHERECSLCGNVNPEQIFNIIDAKIVDEYGLETKFRKKEAKDWNEIYLKNRPKHTIKEIGTPPVVETKRPSKFSQFLSYLKRDFLSKISNSQYIIVNALISPFLALVLSFFIKYFNNNDGNYFYTFYSNTNIPQYIFISVIVSIFLGLTIAAEEINRDKKILIREKFLNLSRRSYLLSKITILFSISAIQSFLFVIIGNSILEVEGMLFPYWAVLFSTSCISNLFGLNISSAFNSAKVIYVIVPLVIIPQLLFSGVIVKFDKLHPSLSNATKVPWIGKLMISRWAYEAIAVNQGSQNELEQAYFVSKSKISKAKWKKDYWLPELNNQLNILLSHQKSTDEKRRAHGILLEEISREDEFWSNLSCKNCIKDLSSYQDFAVKDFKEVNAFLDKIRLNSISTINKESMNFERIIDSIGVDKFKTLRDIYLNESLEAILTNKIDENKFIIKDDKIYQNSDPIYNDPAGVSIFNTHFYSPYKYIFGYRFNTLWANIIIMWVIGIITYIILYFDIIRKIITFSVRKTKLLRTKKDL
jgi:ABC-type multidrug transport system ATPase subunit/uncharacterized tellurite resistance protein B-like protein